MKHWNKISFVLSGIVFYLAYKHGIFAALGEPDSRVASGILAQIAATMLGFLIAALSILASISGTRLVKNMQKTGHYRKLLRCFLINSVAYGVAMTCSFWALISKSHFPIPALVALTTFSFASLLLIDVCWRFWLVLHSLAPDAER